MVRPRAFISFEMEDVRSRNFLVAQSRDSGNDIDFVDYSVQDPWDTSWKTQCAARIGRTKGTIVLIGKTTYASAAVLWEIEESIRQGHYIFGIQTNPDASHPIPKGLPAANVIRWKFDQIATWLNTWK
jgi:hypothetical protein